MISDNVSELIHKEIVECLHKKEYKLPSVRSFAAQLDVSTRTVQKVMETYANEGYLVSRKGLGIFLSERCIKGDIAVPDAPLRVTTVMRSNTIAGQLLDDILSHTFEHTDRLPSITELQSVYHANYRTIKRALSILEEKNILDSNKNLSLNFSIQSRNQKNDILCFVRTMKSGLSFANTENMVATLQQTCSVRNLRLRVFKVYYVERKLEFISKEDRAAFYKMPSDTPLGSIVISLGITRDIENLLDMIREKISAPLVLLGTPGITRAFKKYPFRKSIVNLSTEHSTIPGVTVGKYLFSRGHRKIAFLSSIPGQAWSINRYKGIAQLYEAAGAGSSDAVSFWNVPGIQSSTGRELWETLDMKDFNKKCQPLLSAITELTGELTFSNFQFQNVYNRVRNDIKNTYIQNLIRNSYRAVIEEIVSDKQFSVLVCDNDMLATQILLLLKEMHISVPSDISVMGFDDSYEAMEASLTSYNFNIGEQVHCMIDWLLQSKSVQKSTPMKKRFEHAGFVTVRRSVADLKI